MRFGFTPALLAVMMCIASAAAIYAKPTVKVATTGPQVSLETMIPKRFGDWKEQPVELTQLVNPQTRELLDKLYSQILARTYVHADGYRVMISLAYGSDQRGALQAHKPEVCYPAQGFKLHSSEQIKLLTPNGAIPAHRLFTSMGPRQEPVTYWFTVGDTAVQTKMQKRLVELAYGLTGRIPDGLLFRISSIDGDQARANRYHDQFVNDLIQAVPLADRIRLSGLTEKAGGT